MSDPTTTNVSLAIPVRGSDPGTWDVPMNLNSSILDGYMGGVQTVSVTNVNITLTAPVGAITPSTGPNQSQNSSLKFTGALSGNVQVTLPLPGPMIIHNLTTGAFVLSFRAVAAGEVIAIEQGAAQRIYNDGTNVYFVDLPTVGTFLDICDTTVPAWITACTKPPYLNCDGTTFSAVTFPYLNIKLGGNTLPDSRGRVRAALNQGSGRLTAAGGLDGNNRTAGGADTVALSLGQLPTGITSAQNGIVVSVSSANSVPQNGNFTQSVQSGNGGIGSTSTPSGGTLASTGTINVSVTSNNTGGQAHPNTQPTYVGGLTLIRAA